VIMAFTRQTKITREVARNSKILGLRRPKDLVQPAFAPWSNQNRGS
jgi:hypothetical protein